MQHFQSGFLCSMRQKCWLKGRRVNMTPPFPGGIGWRLRESLKQFVEFNATGDLFAIQRAAGQIVKTTSATTADYAMLNQGQLKAIASLFYERLDAIYSPYPVPRPWGPENGTASANAPVTLGQLKNVFSFDLDGDSDAHKGTGP
jgi:hypothetical protein